MTGFYRKLYFGLFLTLVISSALAFSAFFSLYALTEETNELISIRGEEFFLAQDLENQLTHQFATMPVFVLSGDENTLTGHNRAHALFLNLLDKLAASKTAPEDRPLIEEIRAIDTAKWNFARKGIKMRRTGAPISTVNQYFQNSTNGPLSSQLRDKVNELLTRKRLKFHEARATNTATSRKILFLYGFASFFSLALFLGIGLLLVRLSQQKEKMEKRDASISAARKEAVEVVAHDLKNPLASIRLTLQILEKKLANGEFELPRVEKAMNAIKKSSESMERLITDLLDHTKIESGHLLLATKECNMSQMLSEVLERHQPLAAAKGINLHSQLSAESHMVSCDLGRLEQVTSNILGNALKFTPQGGEVEVDLTYRDNQALVSVKDNGPGMSPEAVEHAFDRYWQVRATAAQGTGLGLAIVKSIVEAHHGKVWVESAPAQGTTFFFSLPLESRASH